MNCRVMILQSISVEAFRQDFLCCAGQCQCSCSWPQMSQCLIMKTANSPTFPKTSPGMDSHFLRTTGKARKILQDKWQDRCWDMKGSHRLEQPLGQGATDTKEVPSWHLSFPLHNLQCPQLLGLCQSHDMWGTRGKHHIGASHHQHTVLLRRMGCLPSVNKICK